MPRHDIPTGFAGICRLSQRLVGLYAADAPEVLREDFYNSLLAAYRPEEVSTQLIRAGLDRLKLETPSDRHWVVSGTLSA